MSASPLLRQMGAKLWSIFREDADLAKFRFKGFPQGIGGDMSIIFFNSGEQLRESLDDDPPWPVWEELRALANQLQSSPDFTSEPFTHMVFELTEDGQMETNFAYIPEWDSWPGLYMKGVSQISAGEIGEYNIPHDIWEERVAMAKERPYRT